LPYIKEHERDYYEPHCPKAKNPGQLNFQITCLIKKYLGDSLNYDYINDVMGALEGAKLEFYRRVAAPYEDEKIKINGDVY
jgi:hypothetical protein